MQRLAFLIVLLAACADHYTFIVGDDDTGDDGGGDGGVGGDGGGNPGDPPGSCALSTSVGPMGHLADFQISPDGTQWLLTHHTAYQYAPPTAKLWQKTTSGWLEQPIGECTYGVMALDDAGKPAVACAVWVDGVFNKGIGDYDLWLMRVGATSVTPQRVLAAHESFGDWVGNIPTALVFQSGQPRLLFQPTRGGNVRLEDSPYKIAWASQGQWASDSILTFGDALGRNDSIQFVRAGTDLVLAHRDTNLGDIIIQKLVLTPPIAELENIAVLDAPAGRNSFGFGESYVIAGSSISSLHVLVADTTAYDDLPAPGVVSYYRVSAGSTPTMVRVDGSPPFGDGAAGLGTVSLVLVNGTALAGYHKEATDGLRLATRTATWSYADLETNGVGAASVMRLDAAGHLHIAYSDQGNGVVKVADDTCP